MAKDTPQPDPFDFDLSSFDDETNHLITQYVGIGVPVDLLAYTQQFETLYTQYKETTGDTAISRAELFRRLLSLRKSGRLPRLLRKSGTLDDASYDNESA